MLLSGIERFHDEGFALRAEFKEGFHLLGREAHEKGHRFREGIQQCVDPGEFRRIEREIDEFRHGMRRSEGVWRGAKHAPFPLSVHVKMRVTGGDQP